MPAAVRTCILSSARKLHLYLGVLSVTARHRTFCALQCLVYVDVSAEIDSMSLFSVPAARTHCLQTSLLWIA